VRRDGAFWWLVNDQKSFLPDEWYAQGIEEGCDHLIDLNARETR
jgi:hypothetical protein